MFFRKNQLWIRMHVYTCVYVCVCMFVHRFWVSVAILRRVWAVSYMHMCVLVRMYAYAYVCMYIYMCIFLQWVLRLTRWGIIAGIFFLWIDVCVHVCVYVCACMRLYVHVHAYVLCIYVCLCIWMHIRVYAHACECTCVLVEAHFFYLYCPIL